MGWKDIASKGSKIKDSVVSNAKYCTSVLNDFGFVKKALFQVYRIGKIKKVTGTGQKYLDREFKYEEQFPVQINPNDINYDFSYGKDRLFTGKRNSRSEKTVSMEGVDLVETRGSFSPGSASMSLTYNIYDEYNAITSNGAVSIGEDISLHSGNHTSLSKLREYAGIPDYFVLFRWGEMHIFGFLENVDISYSVYSPWGQPLVGEAKIDIARQPLGFDSKGRELDPCDCPQIKNTKGTAEAKKFDYTYKAMRSVYQGINAVR